MYSRDKIGCEKKIWIEYVYKIWRSGADAIKKFTLSLGIPYLGV